MGRKFEVKRVTNSVGEHYKYPFRYMEVGDWFELPDSSTRGVKAVRMAMHSYCKTWVDLGVRFTCLRPSRSVDQYVCRRVEPKSFNIDDELSTSSATYYIPVNGIADPDRMRERCVYPFTSMRPGDWFEVPEEFHKKVQQACVKHNATGYYRIRTSADSRRGARSGHVIVSCFEKGVK